MSPKDREYSLLAQCPPPRPLPIALAHVFAGTKLGETGRLMLLNKLYMRLTPVEQLQMKAELHLCREAQRGHLEAEVA